MKLAGSCSARPDTNRLASIQDIHDRLHFNLPKSAFNWSPEKLSIRAAANDTLMICCRSPQFETRQHPFGGHGAIASPEPRSFIVMTNYRMISSICETTRTRQKEFFRQVLKTLLWEDKWNACNCRKLQLGNFPIKTQLLGPFPFSLCSSARWLICVLLISI